MAWHPAKISKEALQCLKVASALTGKEMRELASEAILKHCNDLIAKATKKNGLSIGKNVKPK
jgi:hypothetical protein